MIPGTKYINLLTGSAPIAPGPVPGTEKEQYRYVFW